MRPGDRVWITGGSSGIGEALAHELVSRGCKVAISARRADRLAAVAGTSMVAVAADVSDREAMIAAEREVRDRLGGLDVAVLNAGTWQQVDVLAWDSELFRRHVDVNVMGLVHGVEAVLPEMRRRRSGTIVGLASVAGYRGMPRSEAYGATKAAQINLLESLRIDLGPLGIRVVTVCPGFVRSEATAINDFRMPWLMEADEAARRIADGLEKGKAEVVFPLPMMLSMKAARLVPVGLWSAAIARGLKRSQSR